VELMAKTYSTIRREEKRREEKRREEKIFLMLNLPVLCRDVLCVFGS